MERSIKLLKDIVEWWDMFRDDPDSTSAPIEKARHFIDEITCPECEGEGKIKINAQYIDGDMYHDAEVFKCETCGGKGFVE